MEEKYIVFQRDGEYFEWEQKSVTLTKERAIAFLKTSRENNPQGHYCIMVQFDENAK